MTLKEFIENRLRLLDKTWQDLTLVVLMIIAAWAFLLGSILTVLILGW